MIYKKGLQGGWWYDLREEPAACMLTLWATCLEHLDAAGSCET